MSDIYLLHWYNSPGGSTALLFSLKVVIFIDAKLSIHHVKAHKNLVPIHPRPMCPAKEEARSLFLKFRPSKQLELDSIDFTPDLAGSFIMPTSKHWTIPFDPKYVNILALYQFCSCFLQRRTPLRDYPTALQRSTPLLASVYPLPDSSSYEIKVK